MKQFLRAGVRMRDLLHRFHPLSTALALSCLGPCVLRAQDAPYRPALHQLRAELDSTQSLADVDAVAARWAATGARAVGRLAAAYIELQRGVVTNSRTVLTSAWNQFDQVVRVHPDWPYARLGLAEAALEIYSRRYPLPATYDDVAGGTHYDGYAIQMKRTLRAEPTFQPAISWLAGTLSEEGDRDQPGVILKALRFIADSTNSVDARVQLVLARAERLHGDAAQSVLRLDAYLREGGDSGVADLEVARSLAWLGMLENAATEYMAGAAVQTGEARAAYRLDLSWVATPRELARFDSLPPDSTAAFIGNFWNKRDAQELRPTGSRLREHLRRWVHVSQHYRVPDPGRRTAYREVFIPYDGRPCSEDGARSLDDYEYTEPARQGGYRAPERVFDHRAIVYMRHGEPIHMFGGSPDTLSYASTSRLQPLIANNYDAGLQRRFATNTMPFTSLDPSLMAPNPDRNVTWVYLMGGKVRAFTFLGHQALGNNNPSALIVYTPPNLDVLMQLSQVSSTYARLASQMQWSAMGSTLVLGPCQRWYLDVVREQREAAGVAVTTDTYLKRYSAPLPASIQFASLGQTAEGSGLLLTVLALRTRDLAGMPVEGDPASLRFDVRLQIAAIDSMTGESVRLDTVRTVETTRQLADSDAWLTLVTAMPLAPGLREIRLSVEQDGDRGNVFGAHIDPPGAGFSVSDIVLGSGQGAVWRRDGVTVPVSAFSTYRVGDELSLYYELYGLTVGSEYRTRVSLQRFNDSRVVSTVTFTDLAAARSIGLSRSLRLDELKAGQYDLVLTIEDVTTGQRTVRQRAITVDPR